MGGTVSTGEDNDDLVDNLVEADCIKTATVESAFRSVDRATYYKKGCRETAYRDCAWKNGNLHLSAPCIYSEVMEALKLEPGLSFLNLGSGTGYLSTMVGLILGSYGTNHGIELHLDVVDYAKEVLDEFKRTSPALDQYDFCEPQYACGNCLLFDMDMQLYDRVYCGAGCPPEHEQFMKNLVKVGGLLVMPMKDYLLQVTRTSQNSWDVKKLLSVTFASLVQPQPGSHIQLTNSLARVPLSLKEICRSVIRAALRKNVELENPNLKNTKKQKQARKSKKNKVPKLVIKDLPDSDNDSSQEEGNRIPERILRLQTDAIERNPSTMHPAARDELVFATLRTSCGSVDDDCPVSSTLYPIPQESDKECSDAHMNSDDADKLNEVSSINGSMDEDQQTEKQIGDSLSTCSGSTDICAADVSSLSGSSCQASTSHQFHRARRTNPILWKRFSHDDIETDSDDSNDKQLKKESPASVLKSPRHSVAESYTKLMKVKICLLPLPESLKSYINLNRPFK